MPRSPFKSSNGYHCEFIRFRPECRFTAYGPSICRDLTSQMERWRSYLKRFKNTGELVTEIDQALPRPNAR